MSKYAGCNPDVIGAEKDARIVELEEALRRVLAWEAPIEAVAPELGGCLKAMWAARTVLQNSELK